MADKNEFDWADHEFVLQWLKDHYHSYHYLTPEAKKLQKEIESNSLSTPEDVQAFRELYHSFLDMVEENPMTGTMLDETPAGIRVSDLYHAFLPVVGGQGKLPLVLQVKLGETNSPDKAERFCERIRTIYDRWKKEYEIEKKSKVSTGSLQQTSISLLEKTPSPMMMKIYMVVLAVLIIVTAFLNVRFFADHHFQDMEILTKIGFCVTSALDLLMLGKLLLGIKREGRRKKYWKYFRISRQKGTQKDYYPEFCEEKAVEDTLEKIRQLGYHELEQSMREGAQVRTAQVEEAESLQDLRDPKQLRVFHSLHPVHILTMCAVLFCSFSFGMQYLPVNQQRVEAFRSLVNNSSVIRMMLKVSAEEKARLQEAVELTPTATRDKIPYFVNVTDKEPAGYFRQKAKLLLLEVTENDKGEIYLGVTNQAKKTGYVKAENFMLKMKEGILPSTISTFGADGNQKGGENLQYSYDGFLATGVNLEPGETLKFTYPEQTKATGMYLYVRNIEAITLHINESSVYNVNLDSSMKNGYIISLPEEEIEVLELEVSQKRNSTDAATVSEMILSK